MTETYFARLRSLTPSNSVPMLEDVLVLWRRLLLRFAVVARTSKSGCTSGSISMVGDGECWYVLMPRSHTMQRAERCSFIAIAGQM